MQPREINMAKGQWKLPVSRNNYSLTVLLNRYNTFMPVYLHLLSFSWTCEPLMWSCFVSIMQCFVTYLWVILSYPGQNPIYHVPGWKECFHTYAYLSWLRIAICISAALSNYNVSCNVHHLNVLSSASADRQFCVCATAYIKTRPYVIYFILSRGITYQSNVLLLNSQISGEL